MSDLTMVSKSEMNWEAECERLSMIIMRQNEIIESLTKASFNMADAMIQFQKGVRE